MEVEIMGIEDVNMAIESLISEWNHRSWQYVTLSAKLDKKTQRYESIKIRCKNRALLNYFWDNLEEIELMLSIKSSYALRIDQCDEAYRSAKIIIKVSQSRPYDKNIVYAVTWLLHNYFD
jgi:hypothetical protein